VISPTFKIAAFVLLGCLLGISVPVLPQAVQSSQSAGACHHGGETPAPQPSNFHCCQVGHNSAIVQSVHHEELVVSGTVREDDTSAFELRKPGSFTRLPESIPLADHPPGGLPLRI
jgi:hypothetical protein